MRDESQSLKVQIPAVPELGQSDAQCCRYPLLSPRAIRNGNARRAVSSRGRRRRKSRDTKAAHFTPVIILLHCIADVRCADIGLETEQMVHRNRHRIGGCPSGSRNEPPHPRNLRSWCGPQDRSPDRAERTTCDASARRSPVLPKIAETRHAQILSKSKSQENDHWWSVFPIGA